MTNKALAIRIDELEYELQVIGDMAVVDWDDKVVGMVDAIVPTPPLNYGQRRRAEFQLIKDLQEEKKLFWSQLDVMTKTLTRCQEECTRLVLENRELKRRIDVHTG